MATRAASPEAGGAAASVGAGGPPLELLSRAPELLHRLEQPLPIEPLLQLRQMEVWGNRRNVLLPP